MKKFVVALRYDASISVLFNAYGVDYRADRASHPEAGEVPVHLLLLTCKKVEATDLGLVRLELLPQAGDRALPFSVVSVPPGLLAWTVDVGEGKNFPVGFLSSGTR